MRHEVRVHRHILSLILSCAKDLEGLMIETEHLQSQAFEQVLAEYGISPKLHTDGTVHQVGVSAHDNFVAMKEKYRLDADINELLHKKQKI